MIELKDVIYDVVIKRANLAKALDEQLIEATGFNPRLAYIEYRDAYNKTDTIASYTFSLNDLSRFTNNATALNTMFRDSRTIYTYLSDTQIQELLDIKRRDVLEKYVEYNEYYRMIMGLPRMIFKGRILVEDESKYVYLPSSVVLQGIDNSVPVHKFTDIQKKTLATSGELAKLIVNNNNEYLKYLDKNINPIAAREANEFDIIYANTTDYKVRSFVDHYRAVRNNFMVNYYSEYDAVKYTFYEPLQCINLTMATLANVNAYIPREVLDTQVIDEKYIYDLFESYGVPKFNFTSEYLQKIAYKINTLMRRKGSKKVLQDISDTFNEITIFKYFLYKRVKKNVTDLSVPDKDKYDLYYVRTPLGVDDPYDYIKDESNLIPFLEIAQEDPKWGDSDGNELEDEFKAMEHTWTEGKYLSLNNKVDLITYSYQMAHFVRYVIEHEKVFKDIKFYIDTADYEANLFEVICYLQALVFRKMQIKPDIPDTMTSVVYIYGMKYNIDLDRLKAILREQFKYTDLESGVNINNFMLMLDGKKYTIGDALDAFENNYDIVLRLKKIQRQVTNVDDFRAIDTVIKAITYSEKLPELYNHNTDLETFIASYSPTSVKLIQRMDELKTSKPNDPTVYNSEISEVINILRANINKNKHLHMVDILDTTQSLYSDFDLIGYLETIIDFFKSYTQDLLSKGVEYMIHDINEGLKITERLIQVIQMDEWEQITFQILFTGTDNEILRNLSQLFFIKEGVGAREVLKYIDNYTRDAKVIGYYNL